MLIFCAFYLLQMIYTTLFLKCVFYLAAKCFSLPVQFSRWVWRVQLNVIWASIFLPASLHGSLNQHQHFSRLCSNPVVSSFLIISSFSQNIWEKVYSDFTFVMYHCWLVVLKTRCDILKCHLYCYLIHYSQFLINVGFFECLQFFIIFFPG